MTDIVLHLEPCSCTPRQWHHECLFYGTNIW